MKETNDYNWEWTIEMCLYDVLDRKFGFHRERTMYCGDDLVIINRDKLWTIKVLFESDASDIYKSLNPQNKLKWWRKSHRKELKLGSEEIDKWLKVRKDFVRYNYCSTHNQWESMMWNQKYEKRRKILNILSLKVVRSFLVYKVMYGIRNSYIKLISKY